MTVKGSLCWWVAAYANISQSRLNQQAKPAHLRRGLGCACDWLALPSLVPE